MKSKITFLLVLFSFVLQAQDYIAFNDPNMKAAVLADDDDIDANNDGEIQFSEAEDFTGTLNLESSDINDATGLEYFVNIHELRIFSNNLTTLDLTANDRLTSILAQSNDLTEINLSSLSDLTILHLYHNNLTTIDLSTNTLLEYLNIHNNNLSILDLQNHAALKNVYCNNNSLSTLDLSSAENLERLECQDNNLIGLNLKTSGDHNTPSDTLNCDNNADLTCINVLYPTTFTAVVSNVTIPTGASFSNTCDAYVSIPDGSFEQKLIDLGIDTESGINHVIKQLDAEAATGTLNLDFANIHGLIGINAFINITILRAINNHISEIDVSSLTDLTGLILSGNTISEIDLSNNTSLSTLQLNSNDLTEIDLTNNTSLHILNLNSNDLASINLYYNSLLENVYLSENNLNNLVMANHTNLSRLDCDGNAMSGMLNLTSATSLNVLHCENNQLENSDLFLGNFDIAEIYANDNLFNEEMDLSPLTHLTTLNLANNTAIEKIDIRNGNNGAITTFDATSCASLMTICVDDATAAPTTSGWSVDDTSVYSTCTIEIPSANFEQALIDLGIDTFHDDDASPTPNGFIDVEDPIGVAYLDINNKNIGSLTGINYFIDLEVLVAYGNNLTRIDVSALSHLRTLNIRGNYLDSYYMTLPNPTDLRNLYVDSNQEFFGGNNFNDVIANQSLLEKLTLADNNAHVLDLTNFPNLIEFDCGNNPDINELDVSNSIHLKKLEAANCSITTLDVSSIHTLDEIRVQGNEMTSFILGNQPHFNSLRIFNNSLISLDVSAAPHLGFLSCGDNQLTDLDLSNNHEIGYLGVSDSSALTTLNLNNGNNDSWAEVYATNLGSSCCIQVDDETSIPVAWNLDTTDTTITNDCTPDYTYVPDNNFENALKGMGYDDAIDDYVLTANINTITSLDISGLDIADLTGIEDFLALEELIVYNNNLESIDLYSNTALTKLSCGNNDLITLNVSHNTALTMLVCHTNTITSLDLSLNTELESINCSGNDLEELDVKNGNNTNITVFNSSSNPSLFCINVDNATYSTDNWTNIDTASGFSEHCGLTYVPDNNFENYLETHNASGSVVSVGDATSLGNGIADDDYVITDRINVITYISLNDLSINDLTGVEDFTAMENLYCYNNNLNSLNVSFNTALIGLSCHNNNLSALNISSNTNLQSLYCYGNEIENLDVSSNTDLKILSCFDNQLTSLDLSSNVALTRLWCEDNALTELDIRNGFNDEIDNDNFRATGNPDLNCIFIDSSTWCESHWTHIDNTISHFVETTAECDAVLGVSSEAFEIGVNLYPNPVTNLLTIEVSNDIQLEKVSLFDIMGKQLHIEGNSTIISFEHLPSGIYLVKLQDIDGNSITKKIIKR
jgi:Leucine-rich repeat (LRR) protein